MPGVTPICDQHMRRAVGAGVQLGVGQRRGLRRPGPGRRGCAPPAPRRRDGPSGCGHGLSAGGVPAVQDQIALGLGQGGQGGQRAVRCGVGDLRGDMGDAGGQGLRASAGCRRAASKCRACGRQGDGGAGDRAADRTGRSAAGSGPARRGRGSSGPAASRCAGLVSVACSAATVALSGPAVSRRGCHARDIAWQAGGSAGDIARDRRPGRARRRAPDAAAGADSGRLCQSGVGGGSGRQRPSGDRAARAAPQGGLAAAPLRQGAASGAAAHRSARPAPCAVTVEGQTAPPLCWQVSRFSRTAPVAQATTSPSGVADSTVPGAPPPAARSAVPTFRIRAAGVDLGRRQRVPVAAMVQRAHQPHDRLRRGWVKSIRPKAAGRSARSASGARIRTCGARRRPVSSCVRHGGKAVHPRLKTAGVQGQRGVVGGDVKAALFQDAAFVHAAFDQVPGDAMLRLAGQNAPRPARSGPHGAGKGPSWKFIAPLVAGASTSGLSTVRLAIDKSQSACGRRAARSAAVRVDRQAPGRRPRRGSRRCG